MKKKLKTGGIKVSFTKKPLSKREMKIKVKNQKFGRACPATKRVMIAQDILEHLASGKYIANTGAYIGSLETTEEFNVYTNQRSDVKSHFNEIENCEVCAIGACLMSATKFANKLTFSDIDSNVRYIKRPKILLKSLFTVEQLYLIEEAFEVESGSSERFASMITRINLKKRIDSDRACHFGWEYRNKEERMRAIMKNIIKNKGEFIP